MQNRSKIPSFVLVSGKINIAERAGNTGTVSGRDIIHLNCEHHDRSR